MKLIVRGVPELTAAEYKACYQLNLRGEGLMQYKLVDCRRYGFGTAVMLFEDDGTLLSWALVFSYNLSQDLYGAYFYTRRAARRKGYGRQVADEVKRRFTNILVWPSDTQGTKFFDNHKFTQNLMYWAEW
jgi:GNAT superfamily N-acetyltransferase